MFRPLQRLQQLPQSTLSRVSRTCRDLHVRSIRSSERFSIHIQLLTLGSVFGCLSSAAALAEPEHLPASKRSKPTRSSYKYLICGGGVAAQEALKVFVQRNEGSDVLLLSPEWRDCDRWSPEHKKEELDHHEDDEGIVSMVYNAVGSTFSWSTLSSLYRRAPEIVIGPKVDKLDPQKRIAILNDGTEIAFEKCLIAVGSAMPEIPVGKVVSHEAAKLVSGAQSLSDWKQIETVIEEGADTSNDSSYSRAHLTVVGGGWMSTVVGAALLERGADVTFSHSEPAFMARYFPKYLSQELLSRFLWQSEGGVDTLSYSALRYVVARKPLGPSFRPFEAEVHVGTIFDAFSIVDFRTDHVIFAPTLPTRVPIKIPSASMNHGFVVNSELSVASDIYAAGATISSASGAIQYPEVMRWSADHARATGRHAAKNMLGAREAYSYSPILVVNLPSVSARIHILGDVDGSAETFGYFLRSKKRDYCTSGGRLEKGVLFCVTTAPPSRKGGVQKLLITGVALWEGTHDIKIANIDDIVMAGKEILRREAMTRPELEAVMDKFASEHFNISLFENAKPSADETGMFAKNSKLSFQDPKASSKDSNRSVEDSRPFVKESELPVQEIPMAHVRAERRDDGAQDDPQVILKPLVEVRSPSPRVIWRRHRPAKTIRVRPDEVLWMEDEWIGTASPESRGDKMAQAYSDLLRRAANKE